MAITNFSVNNNAGLAASSGNALSLTYTVNYTGDDTRNTLGVTYSIDTQPGGVAFCGGSATQTLDTPNQFNGSVSGSVCLQGGSSGEVGVKVSTATGEEDHMVINYTGAVMAIRPAFVKKTPVLLGISESESVYNPVTGGAAPKKAAPKKAAPKKAAPKKAAPKKAAPKKAAPKKAAPKKAALKKAAPKKAAPKKAAPKKAAPKKAAPKKASPKKAGPKKVGPKKAAPKKAAPKKAAAKKAVKKPTPKKAAKKVAPKKSKKSKKSGR